MSGKITKGTGLLLLILAAGAVLGACAKKPSTPASSPQPSPRTIEVVYVQGNVLIDGEPVEFGDRPGLGFGIETGADARCDLVFDNGNVLSVGQNAKARFDFSAPVAIVSMEKGGLSSVLKKLDNLVAKDSFQVKTETVVAGVRGTSFCVWTNADSTYVCACNGIVRTIDNQGGNEQLIEAAHHSARLYTRSGTDITMETAGMQFHTDELLESVASRIGYTIDWEHIDG